MYIQRRPFETRFVIYDPPLALRRRPFETSLLHMTRQLYLK